MMRTARQVFGVLVVLGLLVGMNGCDWWPPTLQERIGQQDAIIKTLQADKAKLQTRIVDLTKSLEEVKAQAAQMEQTTHDMKAQIEQLKASLADAQAKAIKPKTAPSKRKNNNR